MKSKIINRKTILAILLFVVLAFAVYLIYSAKINNFDDDSRPEINALLKNAGLDAVKDWRVATRCGPVDQFEGYEIVSEKQISQNEADELVKHAREIGYSVETSDSYLGAGFKNRTITNDNWTITIFDDSKNRTYQAIKIGTFDDLPPGISPDENSFCG